MTVWSPEKINSMEEKKARVGSFLLRAIPNRTNEIVTRI